VTTNTSGQPSTAAPLVDLQGLVVSVRRRRRLWSTLALLGLLLGAAAAVLMPAAPTAEAKVLVAHQADQPNDPGTLIKTDVAVLQTTRIAGLALKSLGSSEDPAFFLKDYQGIGLTNNVLQITVTGTSQEQALARAKALANAFVADHVSQLQAAANAQADALLNEGNRLRTELAQVNTEIGKEPARSNDPSAAATLESLFARRAALTSQIDDYTQRAQDARVGTPQLVVGTQVVDGPQVVRKSLPKAAATDAGIGFALGLVLGLAIAAVGTVVADRPVLRRDIAANLGASVIAELRQVPRRSSGLRLRRGTRTARERLTVTLARTVRGSAEPVSLLELGCARSAAVIALDLARALAADGPLVIVDGLPGRWFDNRRQKPGDPVVVGSERVTAGAAQEHRLGVGSVAPGTAWTDLQHLGTRTVLLVRAGHGSAAWLHTVARQLADLRIPVLGVVVIDADPRDRTDGTLWDGLQTALRGRVERPARQNGTAQPRTERPSWVVSVPDSDREAR
jgi:hypothetical protein